MGPPGRSRAGWFCATGLTGMGDGDEGSAWGVLECLLGKWRG